MASVYILFSARLSKFYTGSCDHLIYRIQQHLSKEFLKSFTSKVTDWELFLLIDDLEYGQARSIENHIKEMKSKTYIQNLKKYPEMKERLKEKFAPQH